MMTVQGKVVIWEGIAAHVLVDGDADVEIIDVDPEHEDYEALKNYVGSSPKEESTVSHFEEGV